MNGIQLLEKAKRFLVPGIIVLAVLFFAGGFYFRQRGLNTIPQIEIPEGEGEVSGAKTILPQNFPPDIPLFETAEVLSSLESEERIQITLQTEASAEKVKQFYQQKMEGFGWKLTGQGMANDNGLLTFLKDGRRIQITITSDLDSPTLIILTTSPWTS